MCVDAQASKLWKSRGWEFFVWCSSLLCHPRKVSCTNPAPLLALPFWQHQLVALLAGRPKLCTVAK